MTCASYHQGACLATGSVPAQTAGMLRIEWGRCRAEAVCRRPCRWSRFVDHRRLSALVAERAPSPAARVASLATVLLERSFAAWTGLDIARVMFTTYLLAQKTARSRCSGEIR